MKNYTVTFGGRELFERLAKYKNDESELAEVIDLEKFNSIEK